MFFLVEVRYRLFRTPVRTILLALSTILLMSSVGVYFGNMRANEDALNSLSESVPVSIRVTNRNGSKQDELLIDAQHFDAFVSQNICDVRYKATLAAEFEEKAKGRETPFTGGDTIIKSADSWDTLDIYEKDVQFAEGGGTDFFQQSQPNCIVSENYALEHDLFLEDTMNLAIFSIHYRGTEILYHYVGDYELNVIGFCPLQNNQAEKKADVVLPIRWVKEIEGDKMVYESLSAKLRSPLDMNELKGNLLDAGFTSIYAEASDLRTGDAIVVDDELFIRSAGELRKTLRLFTNFMIPFFCLICALITLILFLLMRNNRREIAIADSLGRPKWLNAASHFMGAMLTEIFGCAIVYPALRFMLDIPPKSALLIVGAFFLCAGLGSSIALALLFRFDTIELLTKKE